MKQNLRRYQSHVVKKHQLQSSNVESTHNLLQEMNEQRKEENFLKHYDVGVNKFKQDVKHDNFKRHTVQKLAS
eukprot:CAMPEP_0170504656 /NCGR_PEP_ID=MMETSP0208-20121228/48606_1 /TAXON_ID=197538 /ORGANISM="Strombidium inclinatum, Strain S3" /LENGTH=72 /DNA_ID=CAMNT_0010785039 /DNA_START=89 /DNA_END=307 /DNA_ORIENTATION=+